MVSVCKTKQNKTKTQGTFPMVVSCPSLTAQCIFINTHLTVHRQLSVFPSLRNFILQVFSHDTVAYYINQTDIQPLGMESETHKADCCQDS